MFRLTKKPTLGTILSHSTDSGSAIPPHSTPTWLGQVTDFLGRLVEPIFGSPKGTLARHLVSQDSLHQQNATLQQSWLVRLLPRSYNDLTVTELKRTTDQHLLIATANIGLAVIGYFFFHPLLLASVVGTLYVETFNYRDAYRSLFYDKKVRVDTLNAMFVTGMLISGRLFSMVAISWVMRLVDKVIVETQDNSQQQLINIFGQQIHEVWVLHDGVEIQVALASLQIGNIVAVHAGELVPIDGVIVRGEATVDQHLLTGESQPIEKMVGDEVFAATVLLSGQLQIEVRQTGGQTLAAQIGTILNQTKDFKSSIQVRGEKIGDDYALPTLILSGLALPLVGASGAFAILISSLGYNMRFLGPITVLNTLQRIAQKGILIKDGRSLELLKTVDTVVFDKTGTLTLEQPHIGNIYSCGDLSQLELLRYAAIAEYKQTHPVAKALLHEAAKYGLTLPPIDETAYQMGYGIKVNFDQQHIMVGSGRFMALEGVMIPEPIHHQQEKSHEQGNSLIYVAVNQQLQGTIELCPTIRPEAALVIQALKARGLKLYIISGDHEKPTAYMAQTLGIDHFFAETLPEKKADLIEQLQQTGQQICFVGDGINDSIALKKANVSVSLSGATSVATDTAQVILMDSSLNQLVTLFEISDQFEANMETSYLTTIVPGVVCIGGVFFLHFGFAAGLTLCVGGIGAGMANVMWPMLRQEEE